MNSGRHSEASINPHLCQRFPKSVTGLCHRCKGRKMLSGELWPSVLSGDAHATPSAPLGSAGIPGRGIACGEGRGPVAVASAKRTKSSIITSPAARSSCVERIASARPLGTQPLYRLTVLRLLCALSVPALLCLSLPEISWKLEAANMNFSNKMAILHSCLQTFHNV